MRQLDFYNPYELDPRILIVGAGGIGSWTALQLTKLGVRKLTVYDMDRVEPHNLSTTPYQVGDLGRPKVRALRDVVDQFGIKSEYKGVAQKFRGSETLKADIVISAVDSVEGRQAVFKAACKAKAFFIDGRIGGENLRTYAVNTRDPKQRAAYRLTWPKKGQVSELPCTGQQTIYVGWMSASRITHAVQRWITKGEITPEIVEKLSPMSEPIIAPTIPAVKPNGVKKAEPIEPPLDVTTVLHVMAAALEGDETTVDKLLHPQPTPEMNLHDLVVSNRLDQTDGAAS